MINEFTRNFRSSRKETCFCEMSLSVLVKDWWPCRIFLVVCTYDLFECYILLELGFWHLTLNVGLLVWGDG